MTPRRAKTRDSPLALVRGAPRYHWLALVLGCVLGLVAASVHWVGLVVGGALVGVVATTVRRAVLAGVGFGLLTLVVWATLLWLAGSLGQAMAMGEFTLLAVGIAVGLPTLGSLVRGVV